MGDVDTTTEAVQAWVEKWSVGDSTALIRALVAERDEAQAEVERLRAVVVSLLADSKIVEDDSVGPGVGQQRRTWEAKDRIRAIRKAWQTAGGEAPAVGTDGGG